MKSEVPLLVSCEWLYEHMKDPGLLIIDVSWFREKSGKEHYLQGHIPGAVHMDILDADHTFRLPRNVPTPEKFQELARAAGVNYSSRVVLYDGSDPTNRGFLVGARALWTFKLYGHRRVSLLDGGKFRWQNVLQFPLEVGEVSILNEAEKTLGDFIVQHHIDLMASKEGLSVLADNPQFQIIDTRPTPYYIDGHIPGAKSIPYLTSLLDMEKHVFKNVDQLKKVFAGAGVDPMRPMIVYCSNGMASCSLLLAVWLCGGTKASLYLGGFYEWKHHNPDRIETTGKCLRRDDGEHF